MESLRENPLGLVSAPSLREQARKLIRGLIITGQMQPEQLYSVPRLAADLGVSATPVREALLDLEREGLLEAMRNRGFRVVSLSLKELNDIFAVRLLLEVPTIGDIAQGGLSTSQIEELHQLAGATLQTAEAGNLIAFLDADLKFHVQLIATLGNPSLAKLVEALRDRVRLHGFANGSPREFLTRSANEHFKMLDYISKRDRSGAEATMRKHLERSRGVWRDNHHSADGASGAGPLDDSS